MADKKISQLTAATTPLTGTEEVAIVQSGSTTKATAQDIANLAGGGLAGTNYVYVMADGTDVENAAELTSAYFMAKLTMSPSATNRITIVCGPGNYNFGSSPFTMDTDYIDLVSLDGNRSVIFNSSDALGTISITANEVFVKGVNVESKNFTISDNLVSLKVENCQGGDASFGGDVTGGTNPIVVSGTFINCQGGIFSFGSFGTASGTFVDCIGDASSFGSEATGTFINCTAGNESFGGAQLSTASGTFTNCQAGELSFGGNLGNASGIFNNCIGGYSSFGGNEGSASGTFNNCQAAEESFGGLYGNASGTFTNCTAGNGSFSQFTGGLSGKLYYCRLTSGTFPPVSGGIIRLSIDGNNTEINQG